MLLELIESQVTRCFAPDLCIYKLVSDAKSSWVKPDRRVLKNLLSKGYIHYTVSWYFPKDGGEVYKDFVVELDYDDLGSNLRVAREVVKYLDQLGIHPVPTFSGHKSIHLRADVSRYHLDALTFWEQLDEAFRLVLEKLSKRYAVDVSVYTSSKHMIRAVGSRHEETDLYCIPIDLRWTEKEILKIAREPPKSIPSSSIDIARLLEKLSLLKTSKEIEQRLNTRKKSKRTRQNAGKEEKPQIKRLDWIERLVESGLPDGRKRAIGLVIMPYYANYLGLGDDQVIEVCRRFIENSCRNYGKCDKVYESWLRSMLRTVRQHNYKVLSKQRLAQVFSDVNDILNGLVIR